MRVTARRAAVASLLAMAATLTTVRMPAQVPTVFVHGLNSSGAAWGNTPAVVAATVPIVPIVPTLQSFAFYEVQGVDMKAQVAAQLGLPNGYPVFNLIAVGHSNGGLVARTANVYGGYEPMQGIVTIGTPHQGSLLAQNAVYGVVYDYFFNWAYTITDPIIVYAGYYFTDDLCTFICARLYNGVATVYYGSLNALYDLGYLTNYATQLGAQTSVIGEMEPFSAYQLWINGAGNIGREAAVIPNRISVVSVAPYNLTSLYEAVTPDAAEANTNWETFTTLIFDAFYNYYYDYTDDGDIDQYDKRYNSYLWAAGRDELAYTNYHWCNLIGGWNYQYQRCESDGVVASVAAQWPGQTQGYTILGGPGHTREMQDDQVRVQLITALLGNTFIYP